MDDRTGLAVVAAAQVDVVDRGECLVGGRLAARRFSPEVIRARRDLRRIRGMSGDAVIVRLSPRAAEASLSLFDADENAPLGNTRRVMSCGPREELVPSRDPMDSSQPDPYDRAHRIKNYADWHLDRSDARYMPAASRLATGAVIVWVESAKPRLYHPSQLSARGVSPDAAADALHEMQRRLEGVPGLGASESRRNLAGEREKVIERLGRDRVRGAVRREYRQARRVGIGADEVPV